MDVLSPPRRKGYGDGIFPAFRGVFLLRESDLKQELMATQAELDKAHEVIIRLEQRVCDLEVVIEDLEFYEKELEHEVDALRNQAPWVY